MRTTSIVGSLLAGILVLGACADAERAEPVAGEASPATEASESPADVATPDAAVSPCRGPAPAGRAKGRPIPIDLATQGGATYRTTSFRPAFSFEAFPMPYPFIAEVDVPCGFAMHSSERGRVAFVRVSSVIDPESGDVVAAPKDLLSWVKSHPNVRLSAPTEVSIDGNPGTQFDVVLKGRAAIPPEDCPPCIPLVPFAEDEMFGAPAGEGAMRWTILEVGGTTLLISLEAGGAQDLRAFAKDADKLLATVRFATT